MGSARWTRGLGLAGVPDLRPPRACEMRAGVQHPKRRRLQKFLVERRSTWFEVFVIFRLDAVCKIDRRRDLGRKTASGHTVCSVVYKSFDEAKHLVPKEVVRIFSNTATEQLSN